MAGLFAAVHTYTPERSPFPHVVTSHHIDQSRAVTDVVRGLSNVPLIPVAPGQPLTVAWAVDSLDCTAVKAYCSAGSLAEWTQGLGTTS